MTVSIGEYCSSAFSRSCFITALPVGAKPALRRVCIRHPHCAASSSPSVHRLRLSLTPDSLPPSLQPRDSANAALELSSYTLGAFSFPVDRHFLDLSKHSLAIVDAGPSCRDSSNETGECIVADGLLSELHHVNTHNAPVYKSDPVRSIHRVLSCALGETGASAGSSALLAEAREGILRVAWVGAAGLLVIRGDQVIFRTYEQTAAHIAAENVLQKEEENKRVADGGRFWKKRSASDENIPMAFDARDVQSDFCMLEEGDLVIAASDGFFANLSEEQILAFVRPVPDPLDSTLSIANSTCLASWTTDDTAFISYYLCHLAYNFGTATYSKPLLPWPFPPSPHVDDVTVVVGAYRT